MKVLITSLTLLITVHQGFAQSPILDGYVAEGLENNLMLQQHDFNVKKSIERLNQAKAYFLPHLTFDAAYTRAGGGRSINFPVGDLLNPVYDALDQINGTEQFPTIQNVNEQLLPNDFHETKVRFVQPLFNPEIKYGYQVQESLSASVKAQQATFKNELRQDIKSAYFQHLQASEVLKIHEDTRTVILELVRVNKLLVANDKTTYDIIFSAEAELSKVDARIINAQKDIRVSRAYFNFLLNRDLTASVDIDHQIKSYKPLFSQVNDLSATAFAQRQELAQVNHAISANQSLVKLNQSNARLPKVNLVVDAGYQGFGYKFNGKQDFWLAQVSMSWNIFKGGEKKSKIRESRYELERLNSQFEELRDRIQLQVINAYNEYIASVESVEAAKSQEVSAQKSFNIIRKKYKEDQVLLVEFLDAQNKHTNAQLARSIAEYDVLSKTVELQKIIANN